MTRHVPNPAYGYTGEGICLELWHAELPYEAHCDRVLDHEGCHKGAGLEWAVETKATVEQAKKFLYYYRAIPNNNHAIWLNDDGTVGMTLVGMWAATAFIGLNMNGGD